MLRRASIKAKGGRVGLNEKHQRQGQAGKPARIAKPPGEARQPAHTFLRDKAGQHGVVEHRSQFEGDGRKANADQRVNCVCWVGPCEPDQRGEACGQQRA